MKLMRKKKLSRLQKLQKKRKKKRKRSVKGLIVRDESKLDYKELE